VLISKEKYLKILYLIKNNYIKNSCPSLSKIFPFDKNFTSTIVKLRWKSTSRNFFLWDDDGTRYALVPVYLVLLVVLPLEKVLGLQIDFNIKNVIENKFKILPYLSYSEKIFVSEFTF